jgi:hypothetical protein
VRKAAEVISGQAAQVRKPVSPAPVGRALHLQPQGRSGGSRSRPSASAPIGPPAVETILNRPLRGQPQRPPEFLRQMDLLPEATRTTTAAAPRTSSWSRPGSAPRPSATPSRPSRRSRTLRRSSTTSRTSSTRATTTMQRPASRWDAHRRPTTWPPACRCGPSTITPQRPRLLRELEAIVAEGHLDRGGADLPPLAGLLRKRRMDLAACFRLFPDRFRIRNGRVVYWPLEDDERPRAVGEAQGRAVHERRAGATSASPRKCSSRSGSASGGPSMGKPWERIMRTPLAAIQRIVYKEEHNSVSTRLIVVGSK